MPVLQPGYAFWGRHLTNLATYIRKAHAVTNE